MNQLFIISSEAWAATTEAEVHSICSDLKELGLYQLPYPEVDIGVGADISVKWVDPDGQPAEDPDNGLVGGKCVPPLGPEYLLIYHGVSLPTDGEATVREHLITGLPHTNFKGCEITGPWGKVDATPQKNIANNLCDILISLLATRNVRRSVKVNKLAKFGIGQKKKHKKYLSRYSYVTTISPPQDMEDDVEHKPTGLKKCPHLRRGHQRRQHFGPNRQFIKRIWVPPVFVNASEEFTKTRTAYNLHSPVREAPVLAAPEEASPPSELEPTETNS